MTNQCGNDPTCFTVSGTVSVIDLAKAMVISNISVGQDPFYVVLNPSGTLAYVTNECGNNISCLSGSVSVLGTTFAITVNPALATPTLAVSNTSVDVGQHLTLSSYESGGTGSYNYNFTIFNSISGTVVANQFGAGNSFSVASNVLWTSNTPLRQT